MRPQKSLRDELQFITEFGDLLDVMQQAAVSKLRGVEEQLASQAALTELLARDCFPLLPEAARAHPLLRSTGQGQLLVVVTSDEGMVGPLHAAVVRQALSRAAQDTQWLCIGQRGSRLLGRTAAQRRVLPLPKEEEAEPAWQRISADILSQFTREGLKEAWLLAPRFLSMTRQDVAVHQLLPLPVSETVRETDEREHLFEPSLDRVVNRLAAAWVHGCCVEAFWSARRAEFAARAHHVEDARQGLAKRTKAVRHEFFKILHERVDVLVRETCLVQRRLVRSRSQERVPGAGATRAEIR